MANHRYAIFRSNARVASLPDTPTPTHVLPGGQPLPGGSPLLPLEMVSLAKHRREHSESAADTPRSYSEVAQARPPDAHEVLRANSGRAQPMSVTVSSVVPISISAQNLSVVKKSPTDVPETVNSEPSSEDETSDDRKTDEEEH